MARLGGKFFTNQVTMKTLALAIGIWLALLGTAVAQCSDGKTANQLPLRVTNPDPADRQAIMDLIHSYNWALDDKNVEDFKELFTNDVTYEACRGGGLEQIFTTKGREPLGSYINGLFIDLTNNGIRTRHIEGNTLLHVRDNDTVEGKTTLLVSIQRDASANVPEFDYTAHLKATFKREGEFWRFSKLTLITDTPEFQERAR